MFGCRTTTTSSPPPPPTAEQKNRGEYVERFPNGFVLIRYIGDQAREFPTSGGEASEDAIVLFDGARRPLYALDETGHTIEFYKVVKSQIEI